jgi:hypothetical protein
LDPDAPESSGIVEKALRSIDPDQGRDERDRRVRQARRERILGDMSVGSGIPVEATYPNFGPNGPVTPEHGAIMIPAESIRRLAEKIVRGITFLEDGAVIKPPQKVEFYALQDSDAAPIVEMLRKHGQVYARGAGIEVRRLVDATSKESFYAISIFGKFKMYAST